MSDPIYTVELNDAGKPIAILLDGVTVLHLTPSERTAENIDEIVDVLNKSATAQKKLDRILHAGDILTNQARQLTVSVPHKVTRQAEKVEAASKDFIAACFYHENESDDDQ